MVINGEEAADGANHEQQNRGDLSVTSTASEDVPIIDAITVNKANARLEG
jgi:hypothetical protein